VSAAPKVSSHPRYSEALGHTTARRWDAAERVLQAILKEAPRDAVAWDAMGYVAYSTNRNDKARTAFANAVRLSPSTASFHVHLGAACRALGETDQAIAHYRQALRLEPKDAVALGNLGNVLRQIGKVDEAIHCYSKSVALLPESNGARINLAQALTQTKLYDRSLFHIREVLRRDPKSAEAYKAMGNALFGKADYEGAIVAFRKAIELGPSDHEIHHNAATALQYLGRLQEAEEHYRTAMALKPDSSTTLRQLAGVKRFATTDTELTQLESLLATSRDATQRSEVLFGLAKAYDDLGRYDDAFERLQAGNQIIRMGLNYDWARNAAYTDQLIAAFQPSFLLERQDWGLESDVPMFVIGMPRSGTTLVEQILASHPRVFGAGELLKLNDLYNELPKRLGVTGTTVQAVRGMSQAQSREVATDYLKHLRSFDPTATRITDKMPFNFRHLGVIALLFPNARIIHCQRDPLDVCLSGYFAKFREPLDFTFNLIELAKYYYDYHRLMEHWRRVLPLAMIDVRYEDLVADHEAKSREIVAFCGLEWDDRCLEFYRTERPILTASNWQVRQPIYHSSVGRWRRYERHLAPVVATLRRSGVPLAAHGARAIQ
jgi:tetratricopeptide (TPR) repeat protein